MSLSNISPIQRNQDSCSCMPCSLSVQIAFQIAIVTILLIGVALALILLTFPISYIVGGILGALALVVLIVTVMLIIAKEKKLPPVSTVIPQDFLRVIRDVYSHCIASFVEDQKLTISELRAFIDVLRMQVSLVEKLAALPEVTRNKVHSFGLENLQEVLENYQWADLESTILQHCPLHWLYKFVTLGDLEICHREGLTKKDFGYFWLGPLGQALKRVTIFSPAIPGILKELTYEEKKCLERHARTATWDDKNVKTIINRLIDACQKHVSEIEESQRECAHHPFKLEYTAELLHSKLLLLCLHGYSTAQYDLILNTSPQFWHWLCCLDTRDRNRDQSPSTLFGICALGGLLCALGVLDESSSKYNVSLDLMVLDTIEKALKEHQPTIFPAQGEGELLLDFCCQYSSVLAQAIQSGKPTQHLLKVEGVFPSYSVNFITGARRRQSLAKAIQET
ncbi:DUF1389 domain-containing protein [Candidatus Chlamydia sanziniae]|uniref:Uncharacterized protein n=1 Tax=Candidatus Chlamydia sanziniae TaxID=1806891 RepID=A0A1A9HYT8_9CHLA|nr:DUF1389 domain-containing protein [Candidatus Chlamydia sanziniae]ANH79096.1 hypothetical protein Cs308_0926 [Candidatus Chlamydia sanziniae]